MTERELLKVLGGNIKLFRGRLNWTQAELSERANISVNFLSDIETGKKWPSPITLVKLADVFTVEVFELLKPVKVLPDNVNIIMEKYTEDINTAIKKVHKTYSSELKKKNSRE